MNKVLRRIKENFVFKIFLSLTLFILAMIILFSIVFINSRKNALYSALTDTGVILSKVLAQGSRIGTFSGSKELLKNELKNIFQHEDVIKANVFDATGTLLSSYARPNLKINEISVTREGKINQDLFSRISSKNTYHMVEDDQKLEFWAPVFPDSGFDVVDTYFFDKIEPLSKNTPTGYVRVTMGKNNLNSKISSLIFINILISLIVIMVVCFMIYAFARHIQAPLLGLMKGVKSLEKGDMVEPIHVTTDDEIGKLTKMFNNMSQSLKEREQARKIIKEKMESKLELKSEEFTDLNKKLHAEIDEHKITLKKLYQSKESYQILLSDIEEGYFEIDLSGRFTFFNEPFCTITEISRNTLLGKTIFQIGKNKEPEIIEKTVQQVINDQTSTVLYDFELNHKGNTQKILEINLSPVFKNNNITGIAGLSRDITERFNESKKQRRIEIQMLESKRIKSIEILAGGIAHEYNNLLHSVGLNLSVLSKKIKNNKEYRDSMLTIDSCLIKAKKLTSKFLSFGRGGKFEAKPVIINDILNRTSMMFVESREDIELFEKFQEDLYKTEADQTQIEQTVFNILLNSGQAMPTGGKITMETINVTLSKEFTSRYEKEAGDYVCFSITDSGIGMDTDTMSRMFDPFFTTRGISEGTGRGLGLASVHGTIINHNGIITASSEPGKGTTITIYLRALKEYIPQKINKSGKKSKEDGKITIMLVDDDPVIRNVGKLILEDYNYQTYVAENGLEAVNLYKEKTHEIDIIILDMIMPVMGGGEAYPMLKEINHDVVVLLSSGYHIDEEIKKILDQGCHGFIQKPYEMEELNTKIHKILF